MLTASSTAALSRSRTSEVLIPFIRTAATIGFAIAPCSLGFVIIAVSEHMIRSIVVGDDPQDLLNDVRRQHPDESLVATSSGSELLKAVVGLIENPSRPVALPLDIRGTDFQRKVWAALQKVPSGTTVSYTQLADRIGAPRAVRAVARACAANPLAVAIPCHRAVRADGELAGYRWGLERKRELLEREAKS